MQALRLLALLFVGATVLLVAAVFGARYFTRRVLLSESFRRGLESDVNQSLQFVVPGLNVTIPKLEVMGFLDIAMPQVQLSRTHTSATSSEFFTDIKLTFSLIPDLFKGDVGVALELNNQDQGWVKIIQNVPFDSWKLLLDHRYSPQFATNLSRLILGIKIDWNDLSAQFFNIIWVHRDDGPRLLLNTGKFTGSATFSPDSRKGKIHLKWNNLELLSPLYPKLSLKLQAGSCDVVADSEYGELVNPTTLVVEIPDQEVGEFAATFTGKIFLVDWIAGLGDLRLALNTRIKGGSKAGMTAVLAASRLLNCRVPPERSTFAVSGPMGRPECL